MLDKEKIDSYVTNDVRRWPPMNFDKILAEQGYRFDSDFGLIRIEVDPTLPPGTAYFKTEKMPPIPILFDPRFDPGSPIFKEPETDLFLGY